MKQDIKLLTCDPRLPVKDSYIGIRQFEIIEYVCLCSDKAVSVTALKRAFIGSLTQIRNCLECMSTEQMQWEPLLVIARDADKYMSVREYDQQVHLFLNTLPEKNYNVLYIDMDIYEGLNVLQQILGEFRWWQRRFASFEPGKTRLQEIIDACGQMLSCPVFLLNMGYSMVACCDAKSASFLGSDELKNKGFLPIHAVSTLRESKEVVFYSIRQGVSSLAYLLVCAPEKNPLLEVYITLALEALKTYLRRPAGSVQNRRIEFEQFIYDFIEMNIQSSDEIHQRLELLDLKYKPFFTCMVIEGKDKKQMLAPHIPELKKFFKAADFAIYGRCIVVLIRLERPSAEGACTEEFVDYLKANDLTVGLSPGVRSIEYFRTFYIMALQALKFGRMFGHDDKTNTDPVYHFEDYRMYHMVDLCRDGFVRMYNHENTVFLCHRVVMILAEYDDANQTNLVEVLYTYLKANCNLTQTARALNFHRNTIMNKLAKIEELTEISLSDSKWPPILLFSCMVYFILYRDHPAR